MYTLPSLSLYQANFAQVYLNIVLDEALEEKAGGEKTRIGMVVIRGNAVVMLEVRILSTSSHIAIMADTIRRPLTVSTRTSPRSDDKSLYSAATSTRYQRYIGRAQEQGKPADHGGHYRAHLAFEAQITSRVCLTRLFSTARLRRALCIYGGHYPAEHLC